MGGRSLLSARFARAGAFVGALCLLGSGSASASPKVLITGLASDGASAPPNDAFCRANYEIPCYSPSELQTAYGLNGLITAGIVGKGQTIILIESYGSPTIQQDLKAFDAAYGIKDPPSLTVLAPLGSVEWNPTLYPDQPNWAAETTLDVEWAHAMAPGAAIVVLTSPVDQTEGVQGLPEFLALEKYALDNQLGNIISQSWGATENTLFLQAAGPQGPKVIEDFSALYARANLAQVTVLAAAGDTGSSGYTTTYSFYPFPTVDFPASSPLVTAVGGTSLFADTSGNYQGETVWNDTVYGILGAGGGGISQIYQEPDYQQLTLPPAVQAQLGGKRGLPDVSYNAAFSTPILIFASFPGAPAGPGWYFVSGTSEATPQWAAIVADLNQYLGRPLGFLNPKLYALGQSGRLEVRDITIGNNGLVGVPGATARGYSATPGWDLASGWGTPNLAALASRLASR